MLFNNPFRKSRKEEASIKNAQAALSLSLDEMASLLKTDPDTLAAFQARYNKECLGKGDGLLEGRKPETDKAMPLPEDIEQTVQRIVSDLLDQTDAFCVEENGSSYVMTFQNASGRDPVSVDKIKDLEGPFRPQLTAGAIAKDLGGPDACYALTYMWKNFKEERNPGKKQMFYHIFRQGLDILDLDPVTYEMLGQNPASMGRWLPALADAVRKQDFFKIPDTRLIKVPLPILQLTRLEYESLTPVTLRIVDLFCQKAFGIDPGLDWFAKTGTWSNKFNFQNTHVTAGKEALEIGQYLLYMQHTACMMAGPLTQPSIYGTSTTNEWAVRKYIPAEEGCPEIYKGMPLRCEMRLFVDADEKDVLGISPYWEPNMMKERFSSDADQNVHSAHDYAVFKAQEDRLQYEYGKHKDTVLRHVKADILPNLGLSGQWSLDIMVQGDTFWIIDMAPAQMSALKECVPAGLLAPPREEDWMPAI